MSPRVVIAGACRITAAGLWALAPPVDAVTLAVCQGSAGAVYLAGLIGQFIVARAAMAERKVLSDRRSIGPCRGGLIEPGLCNIVAVYRTTCAYRRCTKILRRVDRAIDRGERVTAERLMERGRVALAGCGYGSSLAQPYDFSANEIDG